MPLLSLKKASRRIQELQAGQPYLKAWSKSFLKPFLNMKDRKMTDCSQHGFLKGKSFPGILIASYGN